VIVTESVMTFPRDILGPRPEGRKMAKFAGR